MIEENTEVNSTEQDLIEFLNHKAASTWQAFQKPYLLSLAVTDMRATGMEPEPVLQGERLKEFAHRTSSYASAEYKIVQDSKVKARVGIIPKNESYKYQENPGKNNKEEIKTNTSGDDILYRLLRKLSELSQEEQSSVVIPLNILIKLMDKK